VISKGDKVKNRYNIDGGLFGSDVPADTPGKVVAISFIGNKADVEFQLKHHLKRTVYGVSLDDLRRD